MPAIPSNSFFLPTQVVFLPVGFVLLLLPLAMSLVLFVINSNELDIVVGRSVGGEPSVVRLIIQGEPQCLQHVRVNRSIRSWYDPLAIHQTRRDERVARPIGEYADLCWVDASQGINSLSLLLARTRILINMLKPFLDVL
jgi:hypothetical protein